MKNHSQLKIAFGLKLKKKLVGRLLSWHVLLNYSFQNHSKVKKELLCSTSLRLLEDWGHS